MNVNKLCLNQLKPDPVTHYRGPAGRAPPNSPLYVNCVVYNVDCVVCLLESCVGSLLRGSVDERCGDLDCWQLRLLSGVRLLCRASLDFPRSPDWLRLRLRQLCRVWCFPPLAVPCTLWRRMEAGDSFCHAVWILQWSTSFTFKFIHQTRQESCHAMWVLSHRASFATSCHTVRVLPYKAGIAVSCPAVKVLPYHVMQWVLPYRASFAVSCHTVRVLPYRPSFAIVWDSAALHCEFCQTVNILS